MSSDTLQTIGKYVIAVAVIVGAFVLIYQQRGDSGQAWLAIGTVTGWIVRDSAGQSATTNAVKTIAATLPNPPGGANP